MPNAVFLDTVTIPVSKVVEYLGDAANFLTGNEVMLLFLAGSIVSMALGLFGKGKRIVR